MGVFGWGGRAGGWMGTHLSGSRDGIVPIICLVGEMDRNKDGKSFLTICYH